MIVETHASAEVGAPPLQVEQPVSPKERYRNLCRNDLSIPLFSRDWWLDATAGRANWDVAIVEKNGAIVASLPYSIKRRFGFTVVGQPLLTPALGPWFAPVKGRSAALLSHQRECMEMLIEQLPKFDRFSQTWHPKLTNWLPFYWHGYSQSTLYTYTIPLTPGMDVIGCFTSNMRNKLRKAQKTVTVIEDCTLDQFFDLNRKTFSRQSLATPYTLDYVKQFDTELASRNCRKIFAAIDPSGQFDSALYLVWDNEVAYLHMAGQDPELRKSGAGILLIHDAIKFAADKGIKVFDFSGSMIEEVEIVRRSCGGQQTPYFHVTKTSSTLLRIWQACRAIFKR